MKPRRTSKGHLFVRVLTWSRGYKGAHDQLRSLAVDRVDGQKELAFGRCL